MKKFRVISTCIEVEKIDVYAKTKEEAEELEEMAEEMAEFQHVDSLASFDA